MAQTSGAVLEFSSSSRNGCSEQQTSPETLTQPAAVSLDPHSWGEFREQAHRMLDDMLTFTETIRTRPVWQFGIWHLRAAGKANWGRMPQTVAKIDHYRVSGIDVSADTYACTAWFNSFSAFVPPWAHDGGDAKLVARLKDPVTEPGFART